jgi:hypothetical protein
MSRQKINEAECTFSIIREFLKERTNAEYGNEDCFLSFNSLLEKYFPFVDNMGVILSDRSDYVFKEINPDNIMKEALKIVETSKNKNCQISSNFDYSLANGIICSFMEGWNKMPEKLKKIIKSAVIEKAAFIDGVKIIREAKTMALFIKMAKESLEFKGAAGYFDKGELKYAGIKKQDLISIKADYDDLRSCEKFSEVIEILREAAFIEFEATGSFSYVKDSLDQYYNNEEFHLLTGSFCHIKNSDKQQCNKEEFRFIGSSSLIMGKSILEWVSPVKLK